MKIKLKNNVTMEPRSLRGYYEGSVPFLKNHLSYLKRVLKNLKSGRAATCCSIVAVQNEIELKQHPDYKKFHEAWLIEYNERVIKWNQERETHNFFLDKEIANLKAKRKQPLKVGV